MICRLPVLAGPAGALGASYNSPYLSVDGTYHSCPSGQVSSVDGVSRLVVLVFLTKTLFNLIISMVRGILLITKICNLCDKWLEIWNTNNMY